MRRKVLCLFVLIVCVLGIGTVSVYAVTGQEIVNDLINNYVGKYQYVYGTHGPNTFDCSGLVYYVYKQHGIDLPSTTKTDWTQYGTVITDTSQLKDGDILLFGSSWSSLNHMGIYDSNGGYIIQALNENRDIIREPTLSTWINSPGWNSNGSNQFQYAVRVLGGVDPTPPSNAQISIDKESVKCGETFKITCNSNTPSQYYLAIFDADSGEKIIAENVTNGVFQNSFQKAGKYNAYMTAYNSEGSVNSNWITFFVYGSPPTKATLSVNKTELNTNDTVTLKTRTDAYYVRIYTSIFKNDNLIYSGEIPYDFNYTASSDGIYTAHVTAYTHEGGVDSNWVTFYVGKYSVSYNANGGSGVPSTQTKIYGKNLIISNSIPTREGYTFKGWNTKPNGTGTSYSSAGVYNLNSNITLYAQWNQNSTNTSTSTTATRTNGAIEVQTTISNLTQSAQCDIAVYSSDGALLGQAVNDANSSTNSVTAYFPNYPNASYVKVFLWDSLEGMRPLTNGERIGL